MAGRGRALSDLEAVLAEMIRRDGPLPVGRFMDLALNHPTCGYYRRRDPARGAGRLRHRAGTQPGVRRGDRGVARAGVARTWARRRRSGWSSLVRAAAPCSPMPCARPAGVPGFHQSLRLHLVETSAAMRAAAGGSPGGLRRELARPVRRGAAGARSSWSPTNSSMPCRRTNWSPRRAAGSSAPWTWTRTAG